VGIEAIKKAQYKARDRQIDEEDSDTINELSFTLSHITILLLLLYLTPIS
jgi:hypothetical protein